MSCIDHIFKKYNVNRNSHRGLIEALYFMPAYYVDCTSYDGSYICGCYTLSFTEACKFAIDLSNANNEAAYNVNIEYIEQLEFNGFEYTETVFIDGEVF